MELLLLQCFSLPFAFLFYFLVKHKCMTVTFRYLYISVGGFVLAVVTMRIYSLLLFIPTFIFIVLVGWVPPSNIHMWAFGLQMLWQTFWHLMIQYREYYLHQPVSTRLFVAVSSLMLLTQRITSVSLDVQDKQLASPPRRGCCVRLLPLLSYLLGFTSLLGGPLCSYGHFVSGVEGSGLRPSPRPLATTVALKLIQVFFLESVRFGLVRSIRRNDPARSAALWGLAWVWALALVLRIRYYSHWRISECLNDAAGLGPPPGNSSDGDFWTTEASSRTSQFARRWNATTASWLRRAVYVRCKRFPLFMTFGFSLWWHGLHLGHFVGFLTWAAAVTADQCVHRRLSPKLCSRWRKLLYTSLSWINTQMIVTWVVVAVEFRNTSGLRLLLGTYVGLFPLCNMVLLILVKLNIVS